MSSCSLLLYSLNTKLKMFPGDSQRDKQAIILTWNDETYSPTPQLWNQISCCFPAQYNLDYFKWRMPSAI